MALPKRALSNFDLLKHAKIIPGFRGVFMRDTLPQKPMRNECGILNLDIDQNLGSHWTTWIKTNNKTIYFDPYGNLKPCKEFIKYIKYPKNIFYNYDNQQKFNTYNCGHLCLAFLYKNLNV